MSVIKTDTVLDAKGLACPMPIVRTKKQLNAMEAGQIVEVQATDQGSKADIKAWAESAGHQYLGTIEEGEVLKHYIRKTSDAEKEAPKHPDRVDNEDLERILDHPGKVVLDVREEAEYAFQHIPGAISIPLGELEKRSKELDTSQEIYIVCRTGSRSDLAAQQLTKQGFTHVFNVIPGMSEWKGKTSSLLKE